MSPDTEHLLLEAARIQATVPDQLTAILAHISDFRLESATHYAALDKRLDVHISKCAMMHPMLESRLSKDEADIQRIFDARANENQRDRVSLAAKVEFLEAEATEEEEKTASVKIEHRTYWTRTAIATVVGIVTAALGAGGILHALIFRR